MSAGPSDEHASRFSPAQWLLLFVLAAINFTHILDFVIVMPLATHLEADLGIHTGQFGRMVSAYGFAAALAGFLFAPWLDRFDRKLTLLVLYAGFTLGTFLCAIAGSYEILLMGRIVAGGFGGTMGAVILAIIGDAFPIARRGTAMGVIMSAFSVASIFGVPFGLWFANSSSMSWRAPFYILGGFSVILLGIAAKVLPVLRGHMNSTEARPSFLAVLTRPAHLFAFCFITAVVFSSFSVVPYIAAFIEKNVGHSKDDIPWMYVIGGFATLGSMNLVGRLADWLPRLTLFRILIVLAMIPMLALPHIPRGSSLWFTFFVTTMFMVLTSGRMVPAMAMITSVAAPRFRGSFMSVNNAVQQMGCAVAALVGSVILGDTESGAPLEGFPLLSLIAVAMGLVSFFLAGTLRMDTSESASPEAVSETALELEEAQAVA